MLNDDEKLKFECNRMKKLYYESLKVKNLKTICTTRKK